MSRKCTFKSSARIIEDEDEKYVIKPSENKIKELFDYLESRSFYNFPKILKVDGNEYRYEFIDEKFYPKERKGKDIAGIASSLHYKTSYYKDISKNKYREVYEKISGNIEVLKKYYISLINEIETEVFPSPSHYFIQRNYSVINGNINYCERELKSWFKMVENKPKERVAVLHNNLKTEHYLRNDNGYLINWDKYIVDSPVLDLYKFFQNDALNYDFTDIYNEYNSNFELSTEEKKLFFVLISLPKKIEYLDNELLNVKNLKYCFDKLYASQNLIASIDFKKKETE